MKKALLFTLFLFCALFAANFIIDSGLKNTGFSNFAEWNDVFNGRAGSDILIQGSSRAWVQVDPKILEKATGKTAYNLGINGYDFSLQNCRFQIYEKYNRSPQTIIQILDLSTLNRRQDLYMFEQFYPYYGEDLVVDTISQFTGFHWYNYYLPLVKYAGQYDYARIGLLEFLHLDHYRSSKYKGYLGQSIAWTDDFDNFKINYPQGIQQKTDARNIAQFDQFLAEMQEKKIQVLLVYAPEFYQVDPYLKNKDQIIAIYQSLADKYGFKFYDFSTNYLSREQKYFYNAEHLNKAGSELFTRQLADLLIG